MTTDNLLFAVESFLERTNMRPTTFGKLALKDPTLVFRLRNGVDYRRSTGERVLAFIDAYPISQQPVKE